MSGEALHRPHTTTPRTARMKPSPRHAAGAFTTGNRGRSNRQPLALLLCLSAGLLLLALLVTRPSALLPSAAGPQSGFVPSTAPAAKRASARMAAAAVKQERARGAIVGALVADAATTPLHWIYDQHKIYELLKSKDRLGAPEFFEPPSCPFYQAPVGALSPYGAELQAMVTFLSAPERRAPGGTARPAIDGASWARHLAAHFQKHTYYRNKSIKTVIANVEAGKAYPETGDPQDTQANSLCKLPAVVAAYAGTDALRGAVEASVRAQQNNDTSVQLGLGAALILEKVVLGSTVDEAISWAQQDGSVPPAAAQAVSAALAHKGEKLNAAAQELGLSCGMPGALSNALLIASTAGSYQEGVRLNAVAGGDNCSRSIYLGALLGAAYGVDAVPAAWREKVAGWPDMQAAVEAIV